MFSMGTKAALSPTESEVADAAGKGSLAERNKQAQRRHRMRARVTLIFPSSSRDLGIIFQRRKAEGMILHF